MQKILHCYAERQGDRWQAFCVDFDIAVQGGSFEEVYGSLKGAVADYIRRAHELPPADCKRLLNRRAPISSRLSFLFTLIGSVMRGRGGDDDEKHGYTLPCAA